MSPNCVDCLGRQKRETKQQQTKKKQGENKKYIKNGNNSAYHEPLSKEWIGRTS